MTDLCLEMLLTDCILVDHVGARLIHTSVLLLVFSIVDITKPSVSYHFVTAYLGAVSIRVFPRPNLFVVLPAQSSTGGQFDALVDDAIRTGLFGSEFFCPSTHLDKFRRGYLHREIICVRMRENRVKSVSSLFVSSLMDIHQIATPENTRSPLLIVSVMDNINGLPRSGYRLLI